MYVSSYNHVKHRQNHQNAGSSWVSAGFVSFFLRERQTAPIFKFQTIERTTLIVVEEPFSRKVSQVTKHSGVWLPPPPCVPPHLLTAFFLLALMELSVGVLV